MAKTTFNSSFFFENETYEELEDHEYHAGKVKDQNAFRKFLHANLEEMEFTKVKKNVFQYEFDDDEHDDDASENGNEKKQIRVADMKKFVRIIAMESGEECEDIDHEEVDRDNLCTFARVMDRVLDALEVVECKLFGLETKTVTNIARKIRALSTSPSPKKKRKQAKEDSYHPESSEAEHESADDEDESEDPKIPKRKSKRVSMNSKSKSKPKPKPNKKVSRKRKLQKMVESDLEEESVEEDAVVQPERKKRRKNKAKPAKKKAAMSKSELRKMKREFYKTWMSGEYMAAVRFVEEEYDQDDAQITDLIAFAYNNDM